MRDGYVSLGPGVPHTQSRKWGLGAGMQCRAVGGGPRLSLDFSNLLMRFPCPLSQREEEMGMGIQPLFSASPWS